MSDFLSARAAAEVCGVDERTVRRWVKSGQLAADKRGGRFLIPRDVLEPFTGHSDGEERTDAAERTQRTADAVPLNLELVRLVDRLQQENRDLAGLVGSLQQRLVFAEDRIRALEAPKQASIATDARPSASDNEASEMSNRRTSPWWAVWRRW